MSFFDSLKQSISGAAQSMNTELKKYRSKDLMQAIVSSATLVAYADGEVSSEEKQKLLVLKRKECFPDLWAEMLKLQEEWRKE